MKRFVRILFAAANFLAALLFLAGYLAYHVPFGAFWWFELAAVFLPYMALALAGMAVLLALTGPRRMLLLNAALLALFLLRANPFARPGAAPDALEASGDTLTLLTLNAPAVWPVAPPDRPERMARLVEEIRPDVIGLQEASLAWYDQEPFVRSDAYVSILLDSLGYSSMRPENAAWTQQPVLGKPQVAQVTRLPLYTGGRRTSHVIRARLRWQGRDFIVYNAHLRTFGEKKPWEDIRPSTFGAGNVMRYLRQYRAAYRIRARETERIAALLDEETLPVILFGDMNSAPNNRVYRMLSSRMRDAFAEAGEGWGMTYHARLPAVRIDYVFVSEEWEVVSARVPKARVSDHLPLVVSLRLPRD